MPRCMPVLNPKAQLATTSRVLSHVGYGQAEALLCIPVERELGTAEAMVHVEPE